MGDYAGVLIRLKDLKDCNYVAKELDIRHLDIFENLSLMVGFMKAYCPSGIMTKIEEFSNYIESYAILGEKGGNVADCLSVAKGGFTGQILDSTNIEDTKKRYYCTTCGSEWFGEES